VSGVNEIIASQDGTRNMSVVPPPCRRLSTLRRNFSITNRRFTQFAVGWTACGTIPCYTPLTSVLPETAAWPSSTEQTSARNVGIISPAGAGITRHASAMNAHVASFHRATQFFSSFPLPAFWAGSHSESGCVTIRQSDWLSLAHPQHLLRLWSPRRMHELKSNLRSTPRTPATHFAARAPKEAHPAVIVYLRASVVRSIRACHQCSRAPKN